MKDQAIIVDIDGTIADCAHRAIHVNNPDRTKDWKSFNASMHKDEPKLDVIRVVRLFSSRHVAILIVTGRFEEYRRVTCDWLHQHLVPFDKLIMRPDGDYRSDHEIKREILMKEIMPLYDVIGVFDDRDSVVAMWREEGLTCFQVQRGDY